MKRRTALWVGALLLFHGFMAWSVSPQVGVTADEPIHIVSGLYYWTSNDFRFQPENGNFPQRWVALPWLWAGVKPPATSGPAWERADIWSLGHRLLEEAGPRRTALLAASRGMNALLGCALLALIYAWSAGLWGRRHGFVALTLAAFCPNLLAHAGLATSDTAGTLGFVAATLSAWRLCHRVTLVRVAGAGLAAGLLAVSKFSAVLLPLIIAAMLMVRVGRAIDLPCSLPFTGPVRVQGRANISLTLAGTFLAAMLIAWCVVWTAYGWRFAGGSPEGRWMKDWETVLISEPQTIGLPQLGEPVTAHAVTVRAGLLQHGVRLARDHRILPEAWLYGLSFVAYHSHTRLGFFAGDYGTTGWRMYFPAAWWWKNSLAAIALLVAAFTVLALDRRRLRILYRISPLLVLGVIYGAVSMAGNLNIGLRHWLPVIAIGCILAGAVKLPPFRRQNAAWCLCIGGLLLAHIVASVSARPHYLAYFNVLAGPRDSTHRLLADSNLDWGQGLPDLANWLRMHPTDRPVYLSYFGSDDPAFYPLPGVTRFGDLPFSRRPRPLPTLLTPGIYVFGATQFHRVYSTVRGPWTAEREHMYQEVRRLLLHNQPRSPGAPFTSLEGRILSAEEIQLAMEDYDSLTLGRLTSHLQNRVPLAVLPGGMLVFDLPAGDDWWRVNFIPTLSPVP
jgi:hypothetical protein